MFNDISWGTYLSVTAAIAVVYYFFLTPIFYRNEITKIFISRNSDFSNKPIESKNINATTNSENDLQELSGMQGNAKEDYYQSDMAHELMNELKKVFKKASDKKFLKEELIQALRITLKTYSPLKEGPFYGGINDLIEFECQSQCSIYLNEDETELLWKAG